jgi:hypothetical protein
VCPCPMRAWCSQILAICSVVPAKSRKAIIIKSWLTSCPLPGNYNFWHKRPDLHFAVPRDDYRNVEMFSFSRSITVCVLCRSRLESTAYITADTEQFLKIVNRISVHVAFL